MISWLQTRFQKHYQILFIVLLAVIIVAFVFTIGASPGIGDADKTSKVREVFGIPMTTEQDQRAFSEVSQISAFLQTGRPSFNDNQLQDYAFQRAAAISLANSLGLPAPTNDQLAEYITTLPAFASETGLHDPEKYARFLDGLQTNPYMTEGLVSFVLREDYRADQVNLLVGGPGYVLDAEVRYQQDRLDTLWTIAQATVSYVDFNPEIIPSEEELVEFYENNTFRYEIPERMSVSYVTFEAALLADAIVVNEADMVSYFERNRSRFQKPEPAVGPEGNAIAEEVQLDDVRDQVETEMKLVAARTTAVRIASDFAYTLFDNGIQPGSEELAAILVNAGLTEDMAPPFPENQAPVGLPWNRQIVSEAFKLTEDHWFSDPLTIGNNVIILFFQERLAPYTPDFESVRVQVVADFSDEARRELFVARGEELRVALADAIALGQTFEDAAIEAGLEIQAWADFSLQSPPEGVDYNVLSRLDQIPAGGISDMVVARDQGSIIYVASKYLPEDADSSEANPDFEVTRSQIAAMNANVNQSLIYSDMIREELIRSGLVEEQ